VVIPLQWCRFEQRAQRCGGLAGGIGECGHFA